MFNYTSCCSPPASMSKAVLVLQLPSFMFPQTRHFLKCVPLSVWGADRWVVGDERSASLVFLCDLIFALRLDQSDQSVANPVYNVRSKTSNSKDVTASLQHRFNVKLFSMQQKLESAVPSQDWWTDGWTDLSTDQWRFYGWMKQKGRGGPSDGQRDVGSTSTLFKLLSASKCSSSELCSDAP